MDTKKCINMSDVLETKFFSGKVCFFYNHNAIDIILIEKISNRNIFFNFIYSYINKVGVKKFFVVKFESFILNMFKKSFIKVYKLSLIDINKNLIDCVIDIFRNEMKNIDLLDESKKEFLIHNIVNIISSLPNMFNIFKELSPYFTNKNVFNLEILNFIFEKILLVDPNYILDLYELFINIFYEINDISLIKSIIYYFYTHRDINVGDKIICFNDCLIIDLMKKHFYLNNDLDTLEDRIETLKIPKPSYNELCENHIFYPYKMIHDKITFIDSKHSNVLNKLKQNTVVKIMNGWDYTKDSNFIVLMANKLVKIPFKVINLFYCPDEIFDLLKSCIDSQKGEGIKYFTMYKILFFIINNTSYYSENNIFIYDTEYIIEKQKEYYDYIKKNAKPIIDNEIIKNYKLFYAKSNIIKPNLYEYHIIHIVELIKSIIVNTDFINFIKLKHNFPYKITNSKIINAILIKFIENDSYYIFNLIRQLFLLFNNYFGKLNIYCKDNLIYNCLHETKRDYYIQCIKIDDTKYFCIKYLDYIPPYITKQLKPTKYQIKDGKYKIKFHKNVEYICIFKHQLETLKTDYENNIIRKIFSFYDDVRFLTLNNIVCETLRSNKIGLKRNINYVTLSFYKKLENNSNSIFINIDKSLSDAKYNYIIPIYAFISNIRKQKKTVNFYRHKKDLYDIKKNIFRTLINKTPFHDYKAQLDFKLKCNNNKYNNKYNNNLSQNIVYDLPYESEIRTYDSWSLITIKYSGFGFNIGQKIFFGNKFSNVTFHIPMYTKTYMINTDFTNETIINDDTFKFFHTYTSPENYGILEMDKNTKIWLASYKIEIKKCDEMLYGKYYKDINIIFYDSMKHNYVKNIFFENLKNNKNNYSEKYDKVETFVSKKNYVFTSLKTKNNIIILTLIYTITKNLFCINNKRIKLFIPQQKVKFYFDYIHNNNDNELIENIDLKDDEFTDLVEDYY